VVTVLEGVKGKVSHATRVVYVKGRDVFGADQDIQKAADAGDMHWRVVPGEFEIMLGKSSADIPLKGILKVTP
jgi:hypothetical protein